MQELTGGLMASYKVRRRYNKTSVLDTGTTARRYYKYGNTPNVDVVGVPTINGMVVSGFSTANYVLTRPQAIIKYTPTADNWEMVFKINFVVSSAIQSIWCCGDTGYCARLRIDTSEKILFQGGNSSSSYNVFNITGTTVLATNTTYWIKCEFTGSAYNLYLSTDGKIWNLEGTKASTTKLTYGGHEVLGFDRANAKYPLASSLDLAGCYYKVNGGYLWRGIQPEPATEDDYDYYEEYKVVSTYCPDYIPPIDSADPVDPIEPGI